MQWIIPEKPASNFRNGDGLYLDKITKSFITKGGVTEALNDLSLVIRPAEIAIILGPNGAGKSTLLNILANIIRPTAGSISVQLSDSRVEMMTVDVCGFVLAGGRDLIQEFSVVENLEYYAALLKVNSKEKIELMKGLINLFNLSIHKNKKIKNLSQGLKQSVSICISLMGKPKFLILDEPTANLDQEKITILISALKDLCNKGVGILLTTHDFDFAETCGERILLMSDGKLIEERVKINEKYKIKQSHGLNSSDVGMVSGSDTETCVDKTLNSFCLESNGNKSVKEFYLSSLLAVKLKESENESTICRN